MDKVILAELIFRVELLEKLVMCLIDHDDLPFKGADQILRNKMYKSGQYASQISLERMDEILDELQRNNFF